MLSSVILVAILAGLFLLATLRPEWGLLVLLAVLPINGAIVLVVGDLVGLSGIPRVMLGAWHDALVAGIVVSAAITLWRTRGAGRPPIRSVEALAAIILAVGAIYVIVAPYTVTALYAYRALYEPVILMLALLVIARRAGLSTSLPRQAAIAMVGGGVVAALAAWPQVYVGGYPYLDRFYHDPGETLAPAYVATALAQPRAVGTFFSPNEYGAYLAVVLGLLVPRRLTGLAGVVRAWLLVPVALALVLSFSRSGWVTALVIIAITAGLGIRANGRPDVRRMLARRSAYLRAYGAPVAITGVLLVGIVLTSNAPTFVDRTISGTEPSAGFRPASAEQGAQIVNANPLGVGLGMAGPKSTRFGEVGDKPILASETWYIAYAMQVGIPGLILLLLFVGAVLLELAAALRRTWPIAGWATLLGLGTGALFIPVIDEVTVATPLFVILAIGLAVARGLVLREEDRGTGPAGSAKAAADPA